MAAALAACGPEASTGAAPAPQPAAEAASAGESAAAIPAAEGPAGAASQEARRARLYQCTLHAPACAQMLEDRPGVIRSIGLHTGSFALNAAQQRLDRFGERLREAVAKTNFSDCEAPEGVFTQPIGPLSDGGDALVFQRRANGAVACHIREGG
ncbi:MAG: hypothetical protein AAF192_12415 [Pseudomonadota bacterium]